MSSIKSLRPRSTRATVLWLALAACALAFLLPAASILMVLRDVISNDITGTAGASMMRQTATIDGDPAHFDPVAGLNQAMSLAGPGARLELLRAAGVRRDGTLDLTADYLPAPSATYEFHRDAPAPKTEPPVGAGGSIDGRWYQSLRVEALKPGKRRQVTQIGGGVAQRYWYVSNGLDLVMGDVSGKPGQRPAPPPACGFVRLWDVAIAQGAPKEAVAQIRYDARGYTFNIPGIFNRRFGADCTVVR